MGALAYRRDGRQARLLLVFQPGPVRTPGVLRFLRHLRRHVRGRVVLLWDSVQPHRAREAREWIDRNRHWLSVDLVRDYFTLFVNQGKGFFLDRTFPSAVGLASAAHSGWSTKFLDIDNDGRKDIFVAGSHVVDNVELYSPAAKYKEGCFLYRNVGQGRIEDLFQRVGPDLTVAGAWHGVAAADFDNDGTLEVAVSQLNGPAALFVKKNGATNNWILLDLEGTRSNRDGIGTRVRLVLPSGRTLHEHVTTVNGIYSASDKRVHFGLGTETSIAYVEISWPSGIVQRVEKPGINQVLHVVETGP